MNKAYILDTLCFLHHPSTIPSSPIKIPVKFAFLIVFVAFQAAGGLFCVLTLTTPVPVTSPWCKILFIKSSEFKLSHYLFPQWNFNYSVFNPGSSPYRLNCLTSAGTLNQNYNGTHHLQAFFLYIICSLVSAHCYNRCELSCTWPTVPKSVFFWFLFRNQDRQNDWSRACGQKIAELEV